MALALRDTHLLPFDMDSSEIVSAHFDPSSESLVLVLEGSRVAVVRAQRERPASATVAAHSLRETRIARVSKEGKLAALVLGTGVVVTGSPAFEPWAALTNASPACIHSKSLHWIRAPGTVLASSLRSRTAWRSALPRTPFWASSGPPSPPQTSSSSLQATRSPFTRYATSVCCRAR
ncbi:hypothetical protein BC830DRAFT_912405 [Chytriomyces sp. MP71]|nr:hypothetical protein BC830DRAFT_912405 [Chytriomyces sp. MP71]